MRPDTEEAPVAWSLSDCVLDAGVFHITRKEHIANDYRQKGYDVEPLYSATALAAAEQRGRDEAAKRAVNEVDALLESLMGGLMTDVGLSKADRVAMNHQIEALEAAAAAIRRSKP